MGRRSKTTLVVSPRGQVTLPADARRRLGIKEGGVVAVEERPGALILRPATVLPIEMYSDAENFRWDEEDQLSESARVKLRKRVSR